MEARICGRWYAETRVIGSIRSQGRAGRIGRVVTSPTRGQVDVEVDVLPVLRALADPNRLRLFLALLDKERCVRDLVAAENLAQPLVSHHLRVLADVGLVQARRADGFSIYGVSVEAMAAARSAFCELFDTDAVGPEARPGGNAACCR